MDRFSKTLLAAVVVLLAVIAARTMPSATAQTQATQQTVGAVPGSPDMLDLGIIVQAPSTIAVKTGEYVRNIQMLESAQAFVVQYDNRIEVYHIQLVHTKKATTTPSR